MKNNLKGFAAAAHNSIQNDPNWVSPVRRPPAMGKPVNGAQYMNQFGEPAPGLKVKAEVGGLGWVDAEVLECDTAKDKADRYNLGYWHNSRAKCKFEGKKGMTERWIPFSMLLIEQP